ncbi:MAG: polysaccharide deacetylase, partial [Oscillospiraceae bacterium]|nr:polysaccharide deacetylase [Oscillospiraceae bacterium]
KNQTQTSSYVSKPKVYITFDDGPSKVTNKILDTLQQLDIKATFFVIANNYDYADNIYNRIVNEGHSIGIHSFSHDYCSIYKSAGDFFNDFKKIDDFIFQKTGVRTKICRFPGGSCNSNCKKSIMKEIVSALQQDGYVFFDWNALAKDDLSYTSSVEDIIQNIKSSSKNATSANPKKDVIILMHDNAIRKTAPDALPLIVEYFTSLGYEFDILSENVKPVQYVKIDG